jgi:hypothetical protein
MVLGTIRFVFRAKPLVRTHKRKMAEIESFGAYVRAGFAASDFIATSLTLDVPLP